jgi:hypothetical protein
MKLYLGGWLMLNKVFDGLVVFVLLVLDCLLEEIVVLAETFFLTLAGVAGPTILFLVVFVETFFAGVEAFFLAVVVAFLLLPVSAGINFFAVVLTAFHAF